MYQIGICDDGQQVCSQIEKAILNYRNTHHIELNIQIWYTGERLVEYLSCGNHLDILYLDIELVKMNGIDIGTFIRNQLKNHTMQIIYISGRQSYAQQLFKIQPMDFLIKPFRETEIEETLKLALHIVGNNQKRFEFQNGKEYYYIPYGDIFGFISEGRRIRIITSGGEKVFYGKLKEIQKELPEEFMAIHKSYIVNRQHIRRYTYEEVELDDGRILVISQVQRKHVREKLLKEL